MSYPYGPERLTIRTRYFDITQLSSRRANSSDALRQRWTHSAVPSAPPRRFSDGLPRPALAPSLSSQRGIWASQVLPRTNTRSLSDPLSLHTVRHCLYLRHQHTVSSQDELRNNDYNLD